MKNLHRQGAKDAKDAKEFKKVFFSSWRPLRSLRLGGKSS
jgi:hypothetical protein